MAFLEVRRDVPGVGDLVRFGRDDDYTESYVEVRVVGKREGDWVVVNLRVPVPENVKGVLLTTNYSMLPGSEGNTLTWMKWGSPIELEIVKRANP